MEFGGRGSFRESEADPFQMIFLFVSLPSASIFLFERPIKRQIARSPVDQRAAARGRERNVKPLAAIEATRRRPLSTEASN
jgi:hypothetical protein